MPAMRIICPVCKIWLVDVYMVGGEGTFWCLRCESSDSKAVLPVVSDLWDATMSGLEGNLEIINEDG